jgi:hypothetical protein
MSKKNRVCLGEVLRFHRALPRQVQREDDSIGKELFMQHALAMYHNCRYNVYFVALIVATKGARTKQRKTKILESLPRTTPRARVYYQLIMDQWEEFQRNMQFIDYLARPSLIGEAILGLALLLPISFNWLKRNKITRKSKALLYEEAKETMEQHRDLLVLAQDLLPYADWIRQNRWQDGDAPPVLKGIEDAEFEDAEFEDADEVDDEE